MERLEIKLTHERPAEAIELQNRVKESEHSFQDYPYTPEDKTTLREELVRVTQIMETLRLIKEHTFGADCGACGKNCAVTAHEIEMGLNVRCRPKEFKG